MSALCRVKRFNAAFICRTPAIAVPTLELISQHHQVCAVLTAPDAQSGRGRQNQFSAVKIAALAKEIPVLQPDKLDQTVREQVANFQPDLLVVLRTVKFLDQSFESISAGGINLHPVSCLGTADQARLVARFWTAVYKPA